MKHIHSVDLDPDLALLGWEDRNVRLAEDDKEVAFAGVLEIVGHVQVGVHALRTGRRPSLLNSVACAS